MVREQSPDNASQNLQNGKTLARRDLGMLYSYINIVGQVLRSISPQIHPKNFDAYPWRQNSLVMVTETWELDDSGDQERHLSVILYDGLVVEFGRATIDAASPGSMTLELVSNKGDPGVSCTEKGTVLDLHHIVSLASLAIDNSPALMVSKESFKQYRVPDCVVVSRWGNSESVSVSFACFFYISEATYQCIKSLTWSVLLGRYP